MYQRIGFKCLAATRFQDAGNLFLKGDLDPLLLIRLFPDLRGGMITTTDEIDVYAGIADDIRTMNSIDEIGESLRHILFLHSFRLPGFFSLHFLFLRRA